MCNESLKNKYRFSFINVTKEVKAKFKDSRCFLIISLNQRAYQGERFVAVLKTINRFFNGCTIMVADTLQRHTLGIKHHEYDAQKLSEMAKDLGNQWVKDNDNSIKECLNIEHKISRWNEWKDHKDFQYFYTKVCELYEKDPIYKDLMTRETSAFISRIKHDFTYERAQRLCFQYLIEECAAMCLWVQEKCAFQLYPKGLNSAMSYINRVLIQPNYPELLQEIAFHVREK